MRRYLYLSTAVAGVMMTAGAGASFAQCVTTQNCAELGYTETSCPDGTGLKCPFGDTFACTGGSCANDCAELGFTYPCTGANESGSGKSCGGKYTACTCTSGYEWKDGTCKAPDYSLCTIGALFYSDNTCSNNLESGKTLLGVVIMEKTTSASGWIITINPIQTGTRWSTETVDIPGLSNCRSTSCLTDIQASCTNTDTITAYGNSSKYSAAWAAKNYNPSGTPSGKSWCLPSGGLLNNALNNSTNFARINAGITTAGGTILGNVLYGYEHVWSSSECSTVQAWDFTNTTGSFNITYASKDTLYDYGSVRPVMEF